jgi:hypothetical protein
MGRPLMILVLYVVVFLFIMLVIEFMCSMSICT